MKFTQRLSLRVRLTLIFLILASVTWLLSSFVAWKQTTDNVDELFDTQLMLFAKRLSTLDLNEINAADRMAQTPNRLKHGHVDDDALTFAIFNLQGQMLLNDGENGKRIRFDGDTQGFSDAGLRGDDDAWRMVWLTSPDGQYRVAVGQEQDYRNDMAWSLVSGQLTPWLASLPVLLLALIVMVTLELRPLRRVAEGLRQRSPEDATPIDAAKLPGEVLPLANALNSLFDRTREMLVRERRFTSDAAHELRSPLAALRVQTEVVQLSGDDALMREHALENLTTSIDRATRLVDQLLTLSRLESFSRPEELERIDWSMLIAQSLAEQDHRAHRKGIELRFEDQGVPFPVRGQSLLLSLMVRNLLDNAIRYSAAGTCVTVRLDGQGITVEDQGPGMSDEHLARLGERFYRPPGQEQTGSGLGISIVQRIAQLHHLKVIYKNKAEGGLEVRGSR